MSEVCREIDPAGRVVVVERGRQLLEVREDPPAQGEQHLLPDPPGQHEEGDPGDRLDHHSHQQDGDDDLERGLVVALQDRRDAAVDAFLDEVGHGQAGGVLDEHGDHEEAEQLAVRT